MPDLKQSIIKSQTEPVKYLVLSGGGAKGIGYSGVYEALTAADAMKGVEGIAGSSAGALSAAFIATGMSPKKFQELMQATNLRDLLGKQGVWMINKDGGPLYDLLDNTIRNNINTFLESNDIKMLLNNRTLFFNKEQERIKEELQRVNTHNQALSETMDNLTAQVSKQTNKEEILAIQQQIKIFSDELAESNKIRERLTYQNAEIQNERTKVEALKNDSTLLKDLQQRCAPGNKIFFKDLGLMHLIAPESFKDLYVTAVGQSTGELKIFNARDTPDVEVALACRASASIPTVFQPVTIDGVKYVDGGYRDNTPYYHFQNPEIQSQIENITHNSSKIVEAKTKGRTLAFVFSDANSRAALYTAKENFYKPSIIKEFLADVCFKILSKVGGKFKYTQTLSDTYEQMRNNTLQTIPLATKGVSTLSFQEAQKKRQHLHVAGYVQTMGYLTNHELGGVQDHNIPYQEFLLEVYDKVDSQKFSKIWGTKVKTEVETKKEQILEYCTPQKWTQHAHEMSQTQTGIKEINKMDLITKVLQDYILLVATSRTDGKLTTNTSTITSLLSVLNQKTTSDEIKQTFGQILNKPLESNKPLHFTKKDVEQFINLHKDKYVAPAAVTQR